MDIRKILESVNGTTFLGLTTETSVKLTGGKANPLQGRVTKWTFDSNVMVFQNKNGGSSYAKVVRRRLEKEGIDPTSFNLQARKWGVRIEGTPFIEHKGEMYLEVIFLNAGTSHYMIDGKDANRASITGLPARKPEAEQGGLNNKVIVRTYKVASIKRIRINGEEFTL